MPTHHPKSDLVEPQPVLTIPVAVQLNHFSGGGLALAVSLSHTIADGCTLGSFLSHWASVALYGSTDHKEVLPLNPHFINSPRTQPALPKARVKMEVANNFVLKNFLFPNSKLSDLKNKVAGSIINPTRVEVLTSLVYTTVVAATTTKSGCFKPSYLFFVVNVRDKFVPKLPQSTVGNCAKAMMVETRDISETSLSNVVGEIRKKKSQLESIQSVQQLVEETKSLMGKLVNGGLENVGKGSYWCSSFCGFPFNKLDFGWGLPMGTILATRLEGKSGFVLIDTPDGDGIEVMMVLEKECMEIFESDKEMLAYCHI
ncbi:putative deacetylvindoline O-acetyltransferase [Helianthus debilis subsp. tardiflorus]